MNQELSSPWKKWLETAIKICLIFFALNCFFVSIKLLGAFRDLGSGYGQTLITQLADNPIIGLLIGILVTSIAQSSSMTTSLVVGLVAAGVLGEDQVLALTRAIPIILGANVGTTITNTIVSTAHIGNRLEFERAFSAAVVHDFFNILAIFIFLPLQIYTNFLGRASLWLAQLFAETGGMNFVSPLKLLVAPQKKFFFSLFQDPFWTTLLLIFVMASSFYFSIIILARRVHNNKRIRPFTFLFSVLFTALATLVYYQAKLIFRPEVAILIFGLIMLFSSMSIFVKVMRTAVLSSWEVLFHNYIFKTAARAMTLGIVITAIVQSSSVTTSIIVPLAGAGIVTIRQIFPYMLGANVGTTITAILAALSTGEPIALAVAYAHLLFNILGITLLYPARQIPIVCSQILARLSQKYPWFPFVYILILFFLLPLSLIWFFK